ncbi:hypothetical protein D0X99_12340 [Algoriphagus lacus]|uniref:Uncharacterized protein n=1 Tax=Algoriphagus lacus TaxID=2056311 RepID=A0A418PRM0_9BACT|nr:hypothetical protein [Algoriphagus lacus]RIW15223.1 hypothetical protein D0X99_12340 [Algoriphagus lacus]
MESKKGLNFFLVIIALIVGAAFFRNVSISNLTVEDPALTAIYFIVFATSVYLIISDRKSKT